MGVLHFRRPEISPKYCVFGELVGQIKLIFQVDSYLQILAILINHIACVVEKLQGRSQCQLNILIRQVVKLLDHLYLFRFLCREKLSPRHCLLFIVFVQNFLAHLPVNYFLPNPILTVLLCLPAENSHLLGSPTCHLQNQLGPLCHNFLFANPIIKYFNVCELAHHRFPHLFLFLMLLDYFIC